MNKLIIGTVQFGLNYGINNQGGKVSQDEVNSILSYAVTKGVDMLDTSYAYGSSEIAIGEALKQNSMRYNIVSKYPRSEKSVFAIFEESLNRLNQTSLYGYLIHHFDFYQSNPHIWTDMLKLRDSRKVEKIGFSLYTIDQLSFLLDNNVEFDLLQIPYNIFDRQFETFFPELKKRGVEIHTRSVFLQGLFFKNTLTLSEKLEPLKYYLDILHKYCNDNDFGVEKLVLNYVINNPYIDRVLVGLDNLEQLKKNISILNLGVSQYDINFIDSLHIKEKELLNPVNWN